MRVYVVTANVMDRDEYRDYTLKPVDRWHPYFIMRKRLADQYGEYVSIMGVYSTFEQADHRWDELDREGFDVFPISEFIVDANCWKYVGGYAE